MPNEILPIGQLDQVGLIKDTPPVAIPPNAFNDARNVRFRNGSVHKMPGEVNIFPNLFDDDNNTVEIDNVTYNRNYDGSVLKYVAWWPNPNLTPINEGYYLVIAQNPSDSSEDQVWLVHPNGRRALKGTFTADTNSAWQHTFFQGGFSLIINNGLDAPQHITDLDGNTDINNVPMFAPLPGWDSYNVTVLQGTFNKSTNLTTFDLGRVVDFANGEEVRVSVGGGAAIAFSSDSTQSNITVSSSATVTSVDFSALADGTSVEISIYNPSVTTTCGVIRAFGDFLVAGNLKEVSSADPDNVLRNLSGVVRSSDVAAPGQIPQNWNPFATGVSTADEFVLSDTGVVQDLVSMQGNLYMYSNTSISVMRQTGNPNVPLAVSTVTDKYGALTTGAVVEVDGKHLVVGSNDIYIFAGHPGNIQSVSDGRVRDWFFSNINPLHNFRIFTIRNYQKDEIWVCFPSKRSNTGRCDLALIWNYRKNNWTLRDLRGSVAGDVGPIPGGGIPSIEGELDGSTGNLGIDQIGSIETQTLSLNPDVVVPAIPDAGQRQIWRLYVSDTWPEYDASGPPVERVTIDESFDTGPNHGNDGVSDDTIALRWEMVFDGNLDDNVIVTLPENLRIDQEWVPGAVYFEGQRVLYNGGTYEVRTGYYTGGEFYYPNEDGSVYEQGRFHTDHPTNPVTEPPYDNANMYFDTASVADQAPDIATDFWERIDNTAGFEPWDITYVTQTIIDTLEANDEFYRWFEIIESPTVNPFNIYPRAESGAEFTHPDGNTYTMPTYSAINIETQHNDSSNSAQAVGRAEGGLSVERLFVNSLQTSTDTYTLPQFNFAISDVTYNMVEHEYVVVNERDEINSLRAPIIINCAAGGDLTASNANRLAQLAEAIRDQFNAQRIEDFDDSDPINEEPRWEIAVHSSDNDHAGFSHYIQITSTQEQPLNLQFANTTTHGVPSFVIGEDVNGDPIDINESNFFIEEYQQGIYASSDTRGPATHEWPVFTITDPDGDTHDATINAADHATAMNADDMMTDVANVINGIDGWNSRRGTDDLNNALAVNARLVYATGKTNASGRAAVASRIVDGSFNIEIKTHGTHAVKQTIAGLYSDSGTSNTPYTFEFGNSKTLWDQGNATNAITTYHGVNYTTATDFRGAYGSNATPTYIMIRAYNGNLDTNTYRYPQELYLCEVGTQGDYDVGRPVVNSNGISYTANEAFEQFIPKAREALPGVTITDTGDGTLQVIPAVYDETSQFVFEMIVNDTVENANRMYHLFLDAYYRNIYYWNPKSDWYDTTLPSPFYTRIDKDDELAADVALAQASTDQDEVLAYTEGTTTALSGGDPTGTNQVQGSDGVLRPAEVAPPGNTVTDSQAAARADRRPHRSNSHVTPANLNSDQTTTDVKFDVDRPWSQNKVNLNLQFPLLAQTRSLLDPDDSRQSVTMNKIVAADNGFTVPAWSTDPRVESEADEETLTTVITGNDAPTSYESYVQRDHFTVVPEFDVERVSSIAFNAYGRKKESLLGDFVYNKLAVTVKGTNYTGYFDNLATLTPKGVIYIGEDYKVDINETGRYLSMRLSDAVTTDTPASYNNMYSQNIEWQLASFQPSFKKGGIR